MFRDAEFYIVDIFIAIDKIKRYTKDFSNAQELLHDEKTWDAVIRELEIIGEATNKLIKLNFLKKDFKIIVDFRNIIVHEYFGIDEKIVWEVVTAYLKDFYNELLNLSKNNKNLNFTIHKAIEENKHNKKVIDFLKELQNVLSA
jgi:uncharacterized protein with HEPN domain